MVSGAVAFGGTLAIGSAARAYFLRGATIEEAKAAFKDEKQKADAAKDAPPKKPDDWNVN
jgi:hypothetical protein